MRWAYGEGEKAEAFWSTIELREAGREGSEGAVSVLDGVAAEVLLFALAIDVNAAIGLGSLSYPDVMTALNGT